MRHLTNLALILLALTLLLPQVALASTDELAEPIVNLMPHVQKLRSELGLNAEQNATLDAWIAEAPEKRKELERETVDVRTALREAILSGAPRLQREALKTELAAKNTRLIEMRSLCARMLRDTLSEAQFAHVVASYTGQ